MIPKQTVDVEFEGDSPEEALEQAEAFAGRITGRWSEVYENGVTLRKTGQDIDDVWVARVYLVGEA